MITKFSVSNFKNLRQVDELPFSRVNVLIGPNGSGKSSLLQAIGFIRAFFLSSVEVYLSENGWSFSDLPNLRERHKRIDWNLEFDLDGDREGRYGGTFTYHVSLSPKRYLGIGEERVTYRSGEQTQPIELLARQGRSVRLLNRKSGQIEELSALSLPASVVGRLDPHRDRDKYPELLRFWSWAEGIRSFLLWDPKVLRMPDRGRHDTLGASGQHLAPLLARMRREHPEAFSRLIRRVKRLFPTVSDITVSGSRSWGWQSLQLVESNGRQVVFNSQQMSDGVLRLLAVTSLLYLDRIPSVITFEEPENGVHPQLLREVVQILRELTLRKPPNRCQVFFSTHSPYVLDEFYDHPEQVYLVERGRPLEGATVRRLTDVEEVRVVRSAFADSLGEAWFSGLLGAGAGARP